MRRRGQGTVEVLVLAPIVAACAIAFAVCAERLVATARAEAVLARALAADAADAPIEAAVGRRARLVSVDATSLAVAVDAPLGAIVRRAPRVRG